MKFVATKTVDLLDLQALHRVRERMVSQLTGIINQIRAFLLERGVRPRRGGVDGRVFGHNGVRLHRPQLRRNHSVSRYNACKAVVSVFLARASIAWRMGTR